MARRSGDAELACDNAGSTGAEMLGRAGGDKKMRHVFRGKSGFSQCGTGGFNAVVGGIGLLIKDMAFLDAGAHRDPLVRGFHHFLKVRVRENTGGNGGTETADVAGMIHSDARMSFLHGRTRENIPLKTGRARRQALRRSRAFPSEGRSGREALYPPALHRKARLADTAGGRRPAPARRKDVRPILNNKEGMPQGKSPNPSQSTRHWQG